jgi:hypothetical protein
MTQLGEMVKVAADVDKGWKCPFEHQPAVHNKKNVLPPGPEKNDAGALSDALDDASKHLENIDISFTCKKKDYDLEAQFTAHHHIPGNESWPASKTQLKKWVDKRENHIKGDIGYDVNAAYNGVDLPGHTAAPSWSDQQFQTRYAFACMACDTKDRQFHDRHPAYSDFVVQILNKIATKLTAEVKKGGCGKKNCPASGGKKYDPPYRLLGRLIGVAARLEKYLVGDYRKWKKPVMTSRFALMYQNRLLTQPQAREQLRTKQFDYTK